MNSCFNGRSGASVKFRNGQIIKTSTTESVDMQLDWYKHNPYTSPKHKRLNRYTYKMEFISGDCAAATKSLWKDIVSIPLRFKQMPPIDGYSGTYKDYVRYCIRHLPNELSGKVLQIATKFNYTTNTFCHGDLVLNHVIRDDFDNICLIDPSIKRGIWNSWMIDVGRLMLSFRSNYDTKFMGWPQLDGKSDMVAVMLDAYNLSLEEMLVQELLIHCRIYKFQHDFSKSDGQETERDIMQLLDIL